MEKEMRELYIEGVAIRGGPESCVGVREGGGEALTGVRVGRAIEPRNQGGRGADAVARGGRQHRRGRYREPLADPARSKTLCMRGVFMRENREVQRSPVPVIGGGTLGESQGRKPEMHDRRKSDGSVLPAKLPNTDAVAEVVEGRNLPRG